MSNLCKGWTEVRLADIAEVRLGRQRSPKNHSGSHMRPYLRAANVDWNGLKLNDVKTMNFTDEEAEIYRLQPGDIVLGEASGSASEVGKPALWNAEIDDCCFQNTLLRVRSYGIDRRFLLHYLRYEAARGAFAERSRGVGIHHLGAERLANWPIRLPPLGEQRRIVATLEDHLSRASLGDQNLRQVRLRSSALRRSLLDAAVSGRLVPRGSSDAEEWLSSIVSTRSEFSKKYKPPALPASIPEYEVPGDWAITSLDAISYTFGYGTSTRCDFGATGDPVLRIPNIQRGEIILDNLKNAVDSSIDLSSLYVDHGDILFIRTNGSRDLIGKAGVVRKTLQIAYASYLIRFRLIPNGLPADWVLLVASSPLWRAHLENQASSSAGQYNLNSHILAQLPIPVPPPDEISSILSEMGRYEDLQRAFDSDYTHGEERSKILRQSLLTEAFNGRLVPQDPGDEPALVLMERIRAERAVQPRARHGRWTARYVPQEETLL